MTPPATLVELLAARAESAGGDVAVEGPDGRRTFAQLWEGAARRAPALAAADPGRVVALLTTPYRVAQVEWLCALLVAGRPAVVLDPDAPLPLRRRWLAGADSPTVVEGSGDPLPPSSPAAAGAPDVRAVSAEDVAVVQPQPGGAPGTLQWRSHQVLSRQAAADADRLRLRPSDRVAGLLPLSSPYGLRMLLAAWHAGSATVLFDPRTDGWSDLPAWWAAQQISVAPMTGPLLERCGWDEAVAAPALRTVVLGEHSTAGLRAPAAVVVLEAPVPTEDLEDSSGTQVRERQPAADEPRSSAAGVGPAGPESEEGPTDPIEAALGGIWSELLDLHPVPRDRDFFELGGHSLLAARMLVLLEQRTGVTLPMAVFLDATTVEDLARAARYPDERVVPLPLVHLQAGDAGRSPLFLTHDLQGSAWRLRPLARAVGPDRPVYGFESPMLDGRLPFDSIEALAAHYVDAMRSVQPHGPYQLAGYSFGGILAFEMARLLRRAGDDVAVLGVIDVGPGYRGVGYSRTDAPPLPYLTDAVERADGRLPARLTVLRRLWLNPRVLAARWTRCLRRGEAIPPDQRLWFAWWAHWHLVGPQWAPSRYDGRIDLFRADTTTVTDPAMGWGDHATVVVHPVSGDHETLLAPPTVDVIGARLRTLLE